MAAANYDWMIEQGVTLIKTFVLKDSDGVVIDLTGYTARMQIRQKVHSTTSYVDATTANGKLAIDGSNGKITLTLTDTETSAFEWTAGVYDLEIEATDGTVSRVIQGAVTVSQEVTR